MNRLRETSERSTDSDEALRAAAPTSSSLEGPSGGSGRLAACRECSGTVSHQATQCPHCGAPYPAKPDWDGYGYEYKSKTTIFGIPLVHAWAIAQFGFANRLIAQIGVYVTEGMGQFVWKLPDLLALL